MKVSIIIPVYNVALYIERCIKSVMSQTYNGEIECILVNDATPDDSMDIAERLIADYRGSISFRILNHEYNRGQSAAKNTGINAATGDYLYFLDSDDEITPDCIEKLSRPILNNSSVDMVEGCYVIIRQDHDNVTKNQPFPRPQLEFKTHQAVRDFYFSRRYENKFSTNRLISKEFLKANKLYFKSFRCGEDDFWHFQYNKYLSHLYIIPDITYKYIKRPNSITTNKNINYREVFEPIYEEIAKNLSPEDSVREIKYFLKGFSLFYLDGPTTPVYKQVAYQFLNVLKNNHCVKEWLFLKFIVLISRFTPAKKIVKKVGNHLKKVKKATE